MFCFWGTPDERIALSIKTWFAEIQQLSCRLMNDFCHLKRHQSDFRMRFSFEECVSKTLEGILSFVKVL